jgi:drug/metabolite transporter (DMT)-like permease
VTETPSKFSTLPPTIYVLAAVFLWSTGGLFIKMTSVSGFEVNAGRCLLAALTIGLLTYKKGLRLDGFTLLSAFFYAGTLSCFAIATKMTTAANAIFLQYTAPIYILLLAPLILKEKFRFTDLFTVIFCIAGMSLFFLDAAPSAELSAESQFNGNLLALASGVFFGFYFTVLRHPVMLKKNPAVSVFYGNLLGVLIMLPFIIPNPSVWTTQDVLSVGFLGVFQIGLAYFLFTYGISKGVRSLDASIIGFIEPLLNPVWVFFLLGEKPSNWAIIGGVVIIATVAAHTIFNAGKPKIEPAT